MHAYYFLRFLFGNGVLSIIADSSISICLPSTVTPNRVKSY